jgi:hypothetical protein
MRTTLSLSDEATERVNLYADAQGVSKSRAASDLILLAGEPKSRIKLVRGIPVFEAPPGAKKFSLEDLKRLQEEDF